MLHLLYEQNKSSVRICKWAYYAKEGVKYMHVWNDFILKVIMMIKVFLKSHSDWNVSKIFSYLKSDFKVLNSNLSLINFTFEPILCNSKLIFLTINEPNKSNGERNAPFPSTRAIILCKCYTIICILYLSMVMRLVALHYSYCTDPI